MGFPQVRSQRWNNALGGTQPIPNVGRAALGGLQATLVGTMTSTGTAAAALGALTATGTGTASAFSPFGSAVLGPLIATIQGLSQDVHTGITFTGPVEYVRRVTDADPNEWARNPRGNLLMRHYGAQARGVNIFILKTGVVTRDCPADYADISHVLWGGHEEEPVTDAEANLLVQAGYEQYLNHIPPHGGYVDDYSDTFT
jgi:hypothetical protein